MTLSDKAAFLHAIDGSYIKVAKRLGISRWRASRLVRGESVRLEPVEKRKLSRSYGQSRRGKAAQVAYHVVVRDPVTGRKETRWVSSGFVDPDDLSVLAAREFDRLSETYEVVMVLSSEVRARSFDGQGEKWSPGPRERAAKRKRKRKK